MYYCAAHEVAYSEARQWTGHWLHAHPDEPRPKADTVFVEQVPEGTKIADPPKPKEPRTPREPTPGAGPSTPPPAAPQRPVAEPVARVSAPALDGDDEGAHLDQLLIGIGVPLLNRQAIVTGYRSFGQISQNPYNLTNFINTHIPPKLRGLLPLVIQEMFPGTNQEPQDSPYFYPAQGQGYSRSSPQFWPGHRPGYPAAWPDERFAYDPRYSRPAPQGLEPEASPIVLALQKQVDILAKQSDGILGELQAERAERAKEQQEQREKDRDAALQAQISAVALKVDSTFKEMTDMVKGLGDQLQRGNADTATSHTQQLVEEVGALKDAIASQREERLQATVDALRGELVTVSQKLNAEPTGKTTEDLISAAIPVLGARLENLGSGIKDELKGIREQAGQGKLPNLTLPNPPQAPPKPASNNPVEAAQQIAGFRAVEDRIMAMTGRQPRS